LDWRLGALNTVVLLISSFTMAAGVHFAQVNNKAKCVQMLAITVICGAIFMVVKYFEYSHKIHLGLTPGNFFSFANPEHANLAMYFGFYFCMTGLHGFHVLTGMVLIVWMLIRARRGEFSEEWYV